MQSYWFLSQYAYNNAHKVSRDLLKGVFEQTEKKLMETITVAREIKVRASYIFSASLFLLSVCLACFIIQNLHDSQNDFLQLVLLFSSLVLLFTTVLSAIAIAPPKIYGTGSEPRHTLNRNVVDAESQMTTFLLNECNDYQFRIDHNKKINDRNIFFVSMAQYLLLIIPLSMVVSWFLY